jgi:hypothetical protein
MNKNSHIELMEEMGLTKGQYLNALRKWQPLEELERKAKKAQRRGIYTQEQIDLAVRKGTDLAVEIQKLLI